MPSGQYKRTLENTVNQRRGVKLLWATRREEMIEKLSKPKNKPAWNRKPDLVCIGCGKSFRYKYSPYRKTGSNYCSRKCYLDHANPRKDPEIIERIAEGNRGELNASKRPEVRKMISKKLKGRNAYWARGKNLSSEVRKKISKSARERWQNPNVIMPILQRNINGKNIGSYSEGKQHKNIKEILKRELEKQNNCMIILEYPIWLEANLYFIDVFVKDLDTLKEYYIEVGTCTKQKREMLQKYFKGFINITYRNWEVIRDEQKIFGYWSGWYDRFTFGEKVGLRWQRSERNR